MEKNFLLYLIYVALIDTRERSYENNDKKSFWLCDLLPNIQLQLNSEEDIVEAYENLKTTAQGQNRIRLAWETGPITQAPPNIGFTPPIRASLLWKYIPVAGKAAY